MSTTKNKMESFADKLETQAPPKLGSDDVAAQRAAIFAARRRKAEEEAERARELAAGSQREPGKVITPVFPEARQEAKPEPVEEVPKPDGLDEEATEAKETKSQEQDAADEMPEEKPKRRGKSKVEVKSGQQRKKK